MMRQYGAIPFLWKKGELRVVLVTSASGFWIFPKGRFERGRGKRGTAELEALEEAGVVGRARGGAYRTKVLVKSGERVGLTLYALEVERLLKRWDEAYRRERKVVSVAEAEELVASDGLRTCLRAFARDEAG